LSATAWDSNTPGPGNGDYIELKWDISTNRAGFNNPLTKLQLESFLRFDGLALNGSYIGLWSNESRVRVRYIVCDGRVVFVSLCTHPVRVDFADPLDCTVLFRTTQTLTINFSSFSAPVPVPYTTNVSTVAFTITDPANVSLPQDTDSQWVILDGSFGNGDVIAVVAADSVQTSHAVNHV